MTSTDYPPVLEGPGETDYARYMRTDELLSLQRPDKDLLHRDERLFQTVHQTTELWLKQAEFELTDAIAALREPNLIMAARFVRRAADAIGILADQIGILRHIRPKDFGIMRPALGNGSGLESPGWRGVRRGSKALEKIVAEKLSAHGRNYGEVFAAPDFDPFADLLEAMLALDDTVSIWRVEHYKIATLIIGNDAVGTKGMPVSKLAEMLDQRIFPALHAARF